MRLLFLELAILTYTVGFGWEHWDRKKLCSRPFIEAAFDAAAAEHPPWLARTASSCPQGPANLTFPLSR